MNAENSEQGDLVPLPANTPRHFLQCRWLLWYLKADRGRDWEDCLRQIAVFGTFEEFWALYKHIQPPSELTWGSDYCLFKEGIKSMWEDGSNISWLFWTIPQVDHCWLELRTSYRIGWNCQWLSSANISRTMST
ncbi:Eukaryotic translation initiation factor 4E-3, partial [Toxocara canis]